MLEYDLIKNAICFNLLQLHQIANTEFNNVNDALYAWLLTKEVQDFNHIQRPLLSQVANYSANYSDIILNHYDQNSVEINEVKTRREIIFRSKTTPKVSIIIPFRDKPSLLKTCLNSILDFTAYPNYEILLADNNSEEKETLDYLNEITSKFTFVKHVRIECEFNFSYINNQAANISQGELLLFLNNDTEVLHKNWLQNMVGELQQKEVGAVGAQLLYPDGTIQHAGVVPGIGHVAGHIFRGFEKEQELTMHNIQAAQQVGAVTAACMLVKKSTFLEINGFDELNLKIAYNDVDLCFKILQLELKVIYLPHSCLIHYESKSRKFDLSTGEKKRYDLEVNYMKEMHSDVLSSNQFYHPVFSKYKEDYSFNY